MLLGSDLVFLLVSAAPHNRPLEPKYEYETFDGIPLCRRRHERSFCRPSDPS